MQLLAPKVRKQHIFFIPAFPSDTFSHIFPLSLQFFPLPPLDTLIPLETCSVPQPSKALSTYCTFRTAMSLRTPTRRHVSELMRDEVQACLHFVTFSLFTHFSLPVCFLLGYHLGWLQKKKKSDRKERGRRCNREQKRKEGRVRALK